MLTLHVTATNICNGLLADGCKCPIALAAFDAGLEAVRVGPSFIHWTTKAGAHFTARLPPAAMEWERLYDYGKQNMQPISFEIDPIPSIPVHDFNARR